jgi:predicted Zn-dependent protease
MGDMTGGGEAMSEWVTGMIGSAENGYDQDVEAEADARGLVIAQQAGYDPRAALKVMAKLKSKKGHYGGESYPPDRVARIRNKLNSVPYLGRQESIGLRTARFQTVWARKP